MLLAFALMFCLAIPASANNSVVVKDGNGEAVLEISGVAELDASYVLNFKDVSASYTDVDIKEILEAGKAGVLCNAYDIHFLEDGTAIEVEGEFTVKLRVPKALQSKSLVLVHIADDGSVSNMNATLANGYLSFNTTHFSVYAIYEITNATVAVGGEEADMTWLVILIAALAAALVLAIVLIVVLKLRKKKNAAAPAIEEPTVEEAPVVEEAPAVEAEPVVEEAPAVEEAPVVEEEPTVEEPVAEEPVAEEPVVEEEPAAEEEPVVEEEPAVEEEPQPKPEPLINAVPMVVNDDAVLVRYRSSYMSRLIQAEEPVQDYYNVIKNALLSYKGIKARTSWNFESFNKGRVQCVKLNVKGKALIMYLALNPMEYNEGKYHFTDVSDKPKLDQVPMMLKIRSSRALGYAVELIGELMKQFGIEKLAKPKEVDYHMPYETTEALVERELVKVILPKGVKLDKNSAVEKADVSEVIAGAKFEPIFEEIVHVNQYEADEMVSDERAAEIIDHVANVANGDGKLDEINLDTICDNFEDGETVTLAILKEKGLVGAKAGRIKILARGTMTKSLIICADKFSLQAVKMITLAGGHAVQLD